MKAFHVYPEPVCIDVTYKLLKLRLPVYLMLCEHSISSSEIIAVCILVPKDADTMTKMVESFKKVSPQ